MCMSELQTGQQEIYDYVKNSLGDGMIDVELDPKHYETALTRALNRFRQRSSKACFGSQIDCETTIFSSFLH